MSTKGLGACLKCRAKRVKCVSDPDARRCVRCTNMRIEDCTYDPVKKRSTGETLRMGQACKYCRVKKKKCDAKRPCTMCILAKSTSECVYSEGNSPLPPGIRFVYSPYSCISGQQPGGASPANISPDTSAHLRSDCVPTDVLSPTDLTLIPSTSNATRVTTSWLSAPQMLTTSHVGHLALARRGSFEQRTSLGTYPSISVISTPLSPTVLPEMWIPLSFLGGDQSQIQISETAATDLDMRSRLWTLLRLPKFGLRFGRGKLDALLRGDQSGTVLNRFFVCAAHAAGTLPSVISADYTLAMALFHARRAQVAWECDIEVHEGNDYRVGIQVALMATAISIFIRMTQTALLFIQRCYGAIEAGNMQFIPIYGRPPELSDDLRETLAALSQTIYWANYLFLMCGGPEPLATAKLENEFRQELPKVYPILFQICPLTMRTQGLLLVRDAVLLISILPADGAKFRLWRRSCDQLLTSLEQFSQSLLGNIKRFLEYGDTSGADELSRCCIACLAHLAVLYEVVDRTDPEAGAEVYDLCDAALERLGTLTSEVYFDEYTYLDLLLGDSWKKSIPIFDVRIGSLPFEESGSLRRCRGVVGGMYSDFQSGVPDLELPIIASFDMSRDGTTEDSKYPNSLPVEVRESYGV